MTKAEVRVIGVPNRKESIREQLPLTVIDKGDVVLISPLESSLSLNEHLIWLWGMLKHRRRFLKNIQREGGKLICLCSVPKSSIHLLPNATEMLHLLEMELILEVR